MGGRTVAANNPQSSSCNNGRSSISQSSGKGGERSPGCCSREEGDHRREVVGSIITPSNDKSLKMFQRLIKTKSHPIRRKSGTAVFISTLWQLRKLLYKAVDVVPANMGWSIQ